MTDEQNINELRAQWKAARMRIVWRIVDPICWTFLGVLIGLGMAGIYLK